MWVETGEAALTPYVDGFSRSRPHLREETSAIHAYPGARIDL